MMKFIFFTISSILLLSCSPTKTNNKSKLDQAQKANVYWHKKQIIEQVIKETDSAYVIQIGIMAQAFRLERKNNIHFDEDLKLLNKSLSERKKLDVGIESGSNKIITVIENE